MHPQLSLFGGPPPSGERWASVMPDGQGNQNFFFALLPDEADTQRITDEAARCMRSAGLTVRPTDVVRLHVTLAILGTALDSRTLATAAWAADRVSDRVCLPAFEAWFDRAMTFSQTDGPFVLTGEAGLASARRLRTTLLQALADQGFRIKKGEFRPHMTLCYGSRRHVDEHPITPVALPVRAFHLVCSHVGLSRHERIGSWALAGSDGPVRQLPSAPARQAPSTPTR